jgi:WD40 repeat protein
MKIMYPVFLLIFCVFPLGASLALQRSLVQTTARALVSIPKKSLCERLFQSSREKERSKIGSDIKQRFNEQQTLIQVLTDLTQLPKELIGCIALYNQANFFIGNAVLSAPCSVEIISPWVVAVGCEDGSIYMVDVVEGRILQKLVSHKTSVHALCFSPEYCELASLSTLAGCVPIGLSFEFLPPEKDTSQVKVHAFATEQESRGSDETLRIWRLGYESTFGPRGYVGNMSASQSHIELVSTWNLTTVVAADQICKNEKEAKEVRDNVAKLRAQGSQAGITRQRVWTSTRSCAQPALRPAVAQEKDVTTYWYSDDSNLILPKGKATSYWSSGLEDFLGWSSGEIIVIDNKEHKVKPSLTGHGAPVCLLWPFITPSGVACIASGSDDGTIRIWDIKTKKCLQTFVGHTGPIRAIKARFGLHLVSISDDGTLRQWPLEF